MWIESDDYNGRLPSMLQMQLLQIAAVETIGPEIAELYLRLYDAEARRLSVYASLSVMRARGWIVARVNPNNRTMRFYRVTYTGGRVLAAARLVYARAAQGRDRRNGRAKRG